MFIKSDWNRPKYSVIYHIKESFGCVCSTAVDKTELPTTAQRAEVRMTEENASSVGGKMRE